MYKGQLTGFPTEVVEKMLYYQVEQGNKRDVMVFEKNKFALKRKGGFNWNYTPEGGKFWALTITWMDFRLFHKYYKTNNKHNERKTDY
jgi:hypothetical protein